MRDHIAKKFCISGATLDSIQQKREALDQDDWPAEKRLRKQVQKQARRDKGMWRGSLASSGYLSVLKVLRKGVCRNQGRM